MWFIGVEVKQEKSAPPPKKILDPPMTEVTTIEKLSSGRPKDGRGSLMEVVAL